MRAKLRGEDVENVRSEDLKVGALRRIGERRKDMSCCGCGMEVVGLGLRQWFLVVIRR